MRISNLLPAFLLFSGVTIASAQEYSYARYDVKDGLAGSVVYHGVEDKEGFLWFATETGVSRFDGTRFRNFTIVDGLPDNEILKLFVDSKNRVWMMPFRSSICYYWKGKIYNQENDSLLKRLRINGSVTDIVEDQQGNFLVMDYKAIHFINTRHEIKTVKDLDREPFTMTKAGLNSAGHFTALICRPAYQTDIVDFNEQGVVLRKEPIAVMPMYQTTYLSPRLQILRKRDSLHFGPNDPSLTRAVILPQSFNSISVIADSLCSINAGKGADIYDIRTGKVIRQVLRGKNIYWVFRDSEGNTWFLTGGMGIFRIASFEFRNLAFLDTEKNQLPVFCITKINSLLYVGSERALLFTVNPQQLQATPHYNSKATYHSRVNTIVEFPKGRIMLGTTEGIMEMTQSGNWEKYDKKNLIAVKSMHVTGSNLLVSTNLGVLLTSTHFEDKALIWEDRSTCSYKQDHVYYNGTVNGLYALDSMSNQLTWLGDNHALLQSRITDIEAASNGTLWIATAGVGIIGYKAGKIICSIQQKDGLTSDICRNIFIAGQDVWVGTDRGLNRIQWQDRQYKITTYTSEDGLITNIINAIYVDGSQVYVGTPAGLTSFDADKISLNSYCKLRVTGIQAAGKTLPHDTTRFILPPASNAIRFDYVGISYRSAGDITYRYRLMGLDDRWQTTRDIYLSYPTLPSGDYELQIMATNKFGVESNMTHIPFVVEKHLWEKTWFRILVLLLAAAMIWFFVNNRIKRIRRQNDEKVQINNRITELEQMALKAQMNPHFIFNSLNSVQQYVIDKDLRGANKFITEFSRLIRLTLDISSKAKISVYEEINYLTTYLELEKTKFEDKFSYSVSVDLAIDTSEWFIPPMILQPYVENSIRHGVRYRMDKLGLIKLSFRLNGQYLICQVEDNGVGRKKAAEYKSEIAIEYQSKGMSLTAKRIEMLNKNQPEPVLIDIEDLDINNTPAGTRVTLQFPLGEAGSSI